MKDIQWDKIKLAEFRSLVCLSDEENQVLEDWARGRTKAWIATNRNMSERTVGSILSRLRSLYDGVEPYTPLLPKRNIPGKPESPSRDGGAVFVPLCRNPAEILHIFIRIICYDMDRKELLLWHGKTIHGHPIRSEFAKVL